MWTVPARSASRIREPPGTCPPDQLCRRSGDGTFPLPFPRATTSATRSGTKAKRSIAPNPLNSSQPVSAAFSYSFSSPLPYNITILNNSLSVAAAGEAKTLSLAHVDRTGTSRVPRIRACCSGLPTGATDNGRAATGPSPLPFLEYDFGYP
ncbi:MAG: hypothetical protein ACLR8Y_15895 [Alistipes indistinctus]